MESKPYIIILMMMLLLSAGAQAQDLPVQRPGKLAPRFEVDHTVLNPQASQHPTNIAIESIPMPDRWRLGATLGLVKHRWFDPYNQNMLKGDLPLHDDWFLSLNLISDTVIEPRRLPTPVGPQTTNAAGSIGVFGKGDQLVLSESIVFSSVYYKGDTVFRPPDYEFRFTAIANYNRVSVQETRVLRVDPAAGTTRSDHHLGIQDLYIDKHLRNVSHRYDFDSLRIGIQPMTADFRGFLFIDNPVGIRLFGTRNNNIFQYNIAWLRRLEKDTNSGLNDLTQALRDDDLFLANLYWQDFPLLGYTSQWVIAHNRNREGNGNYFDNNGFLARPASLGVERPRAYQVTYLGYNGDGHIGWLNISLSTYLALGSEDNSVFTNQASDIAAGFSALELSRDFDWMRFRFSLLYATGDKNPFDDHSQGFDAIFENPLFAGADTSFWIRQPVPNIGGGGVSLSGRNGILNSLRSSKEQGQANFINPGTQLIGFGIDLDILPQLRVSANLNYLRFAETKVLEVARNQAPIRNEIGWDYSVAAIYRPFMTQNIIFRLSAAALQPGSGYQDLFGDKTNYSILANVVFNY